MSRAGSLTAGGRPGSAGGSASKSGSRASVRFDPDSYLARSELPLTSLLFLLPLIVIYEVGTRYFTFDPVHQTEQRIIAFNMMQKFFLFFGATGKYMPGLAVVGILLTWHIARRDSWRARPIHIAGIALESALLAIPLIVIGRVADRYLSYIVLMAPSASVKGLLVLSIGAGIYEELVFRLIGFSILSFVLLDVLGMRRWVGTLLVVVGSGLLFSAYHYLGDEPFRWWTFAFRALAGTYFGAVFLCRGFGITAGSHAVYDLLVVALRYCA